jgi:glycosyltransferase involved in cell wall biosynthesis
MNIIITGTGFCFPEGTGATVRVRAFAKGLMHHGATVHLFCPKPTENQHAGLEALQVNGVSEGIPFDYTCGQRFIAKTRVGALLLYLKGLWRACQAIRRIHRETPVDAILLWYAELPINILVFGILAKSIGARLISERSEFPFVYTQQTVVVRMKRWVGEYANRRLLDGVIVISTFLQDYFASRLPKSIKVIRVPILVEPNSFAPAAVIGERKEFKIIYCGNLEHDGEVAGLLLAFGQIASEFLQWRMEVIGPPPQRLADEEELRALVVRLGLAGRVAFSGAVTRSDIPARLGAGDILALPRASGTFSTGGFPTKLADYLATGRPVVVTSTGDISQYLQDGVSAFLAPPDDTAAFARVLRHVMSHPEEARAVGLRGREVAESQFNSYLHGARIIEFIRLLRTAG